MLLPALSKAREKSRRIKCAGNLKQIGTSYHMYADDMQTSENTQSTAEQKES